MSFHHPSWRRPSVRAALLASLSGLALGQPAIASTEVELEGTPERVSVGSQGQQANRDTFTGRISDNGRYVAFATRADTLVHSDSAKTDVFVRDRVLGLTTRVTVSMFGKAANQHSELSDISADGRYVLFESGASNLVRRDTNDASDLFLRDTVKGTTRRVSVASNGRQTNGGSWDGDLSGNGQWVVFVSSATNLVHTGTDPDNPQVYARNLRTQRTTLMSQNRQGLVANTPSFGPSVSTNGRYIAFESAATNLGNRAAATPRSKIFVRDRYTGKATLVSVNLDGRPLRRDSQLAEISADGSVVAWVVGRFDRAGPLYSTYAWDRDTGASELVSVFQSGHASLNRSIGRVSVSGDGRLVLFSSRDKLDGDVSGQTEIFSTGDVFAYLRDREARTTTRLAHPDMVRGPFEGPVMSTGVAITPDGRWALFGSNADTLVTNDTNERADLFLQQLRASN